MRLASLLVVFVASAILALNGCSKQASGGGESSVAAETNATSVSNQPIEGQVDPFLTQQLRAFMQEKGRFPADFAELVRTRLDSRPRVPAGMKWVVDTTTQEVKLVKQ